VRRTPAIRSLAPVAVLALVSALAAGCSGDSDKDAEDGGTVYVDQDGNPVDQDGNPVDPDEDGEDAGTPALTEEQIAEAVLQSDNMGSGWTSKPSTEDETTAPGCFADLDTLTEGLTKTARGGTDFTYSDGVPDVESTVSVYDDETAIAAVFDQVQIALGACTTVSGPDGDGNEWNLSVSTSEDATYDVDDQLAVSASGTFTEPGGNPTQIYIEWTNVRVGPNVGSVTTFDLEPRPTEHDTWTQIAVDRLLAVVDGEEPTATTAPAPA
jgi:hypothetical protein